MKRGRGRPPIPPETRIRVLELRKTGMGYKRIANETGLGRTTVRRILGETIGPSERYVPVGKRRGGRGGLFHRGKKGRVRVRPKRDTGA